MAGLSCVKDYFFYVPSVLTEQVLKPNGAYKGKN